MAESLTTGESQARQAKKNAELERLEMHITEFERDSKRFIAPCDRWRVNIRFLHARKAVAAARTSGNNSKALVKAVRKATVDAHRALEQSITEHRENMRRNDPSTPTEQPDAPLDNSQKIKQELDDRDEQLKATEKHIFTQVLQSSMRDGALHALKVARDTIDPVRASNAVQISDRYARGTVDAMMILMHGASALADLESLFEHTFKIAMDAIAEE